MTKIEMIELRDSLKLQCEGPICDDRKLKMLKQCEDALLNWEGE